MCKTYVGLKSTLALSLLHQHYPVSSSPVQDLNGNAGASDILKITQGPRQRGILMIEKPAVILVRTMILAYIMILNLIGDSIDVGFKHLIRLPVIPGVILNLSSIIVALQARNCLLVVLTVILNLDFVLPLLGHFPNRVVPIIEPQVNEGRLGWPSGILMEVEGSSTFGLQGGKLFCVSPAQGAVGVINIVSDSAHKMEVVKGIVRLYILTF